MGFERPMPCGLYVVLVKTDGLDVVLVKTGGVLLLGLV